MKKTTLVLNRGKQMEISLSTDQFDAAWDKYQKGTMIQDAFPTLSADEREFLLTGITPEEWDELFSK